MTNNDQISHEIELIEKSVRTRLVQQYDIIIGYCDFFISRYYVPIIIYRILNTINIMVLYAGRQLISI